MYFFRVIKVDGTGRACLGTGAASTGFIQPDAGLRIDLIFEGHCLGVFDIHRLPLAGPGIVFIINFFRTFGCALPAGNAFIHINVTGMFLDRHLEISRTAGNIGYLAEGHQLYI